LTSITSQAQCQDDQHKEDPNPQTQKVQNEACQQDAITLSTHIYRNLQID
jgi:hypothetical protein